MWLSKAHLSPIAMIATLVFGGTAIGVADQDQEVLNGIVVEAAVLAPARTGNRARLTLRIDNHSGRNIVFRGIRAGFAGSSAIVARNGLGGSHEVPEVLIPEHETVDFSTRHLGIELRELKVGLEPDERYEIALRFGDAELGVDAHVHASNPSTE